MVVNLDLYIFLSICVFFCVLSFEVFLHDSRKKLNRSFVLFVAVLILWMLSNYSETVVSDIVLAKIFLYIDFALAAILAYTYSLFCFTFTNSRWPKRPLLYLIPSIFFAVFAIANDVIKDIHFDSSGVLRFENGLGFIFYAAYLLLYFGAGIIHLIKTAIIRQGEERQKVIIVLVGLALSALFAVVINLFLQNSISVGVLHFGIYSTFFIVLSMVYAIIRHHIFNIRMVAAELLTVIIIVVSIGQVFGARSGAEFTGRLLFFVLVFVMGLVLIRNVFVEVRRREEMELLSEQLADANEKLKVLDKAKTDFLSIASHQLRSPLTVTKLGVAALLDGTFGPVKEEKQIYALNKIFESNERLISLVNDFLNISRIEMGKIQYDLKSGDLQKVVDSVCEELKPKAEAKKLKIICEKTKTPLPQVNFDEEKIRQVVVNLVDNSIKYTDKGKITCGVRKNGNEIMFYIKDTGRGMGPEDLKIIFEKFRKGGSSTLRERAESSGFGLFVAKTFIEAHKGKIWAESEGENKGSAFYFTLPVA